MSVIFNSFDVIEIDGIAAGNIVDVISNHAPRRAEVLAAYGVYVAALQTEINAENVQLQADKTQLTTDLATANADKTSLTSQVETLTTQLEAKTTDLATRTTELSEKTTLANAQATAITNLENNLDSANDLLTAKTDELAESKTELQSQISSLEAERIVLNTRIAFLNSIRTYDPNQIRSLAFYDRISKDQINKLGLLAIDDPQAAEIHKLLNAYKDNPWPVLLDDPLVVGGIQYLLHIEIITQQEAAQITRPASREEAYITT
jgi:cell division protein FtsB